MTEFLAGLHAEWLPVWVKLPTLLVGLRFTAFVTLMSFVAALLLGLVVAMLRRSPVRWVQATAFLYIQVFRSLSLYVGPCYPYSFVDDDRSDLTRLHHGLSVGPQGRRIILRGRLLDCEGQPVPDALLEFWQANANGVFRSPATGDDPLLDPCFDGFGRLITTGEPFTFKTIKPGNIAATPETAPRAPHITLTIFADGVTRLVTQIFFSDEPEANAADPLLQSLPSRCGPAWSLA